MRDQAEILRIKLQKLNNTTNSTKTIAVISGKGGVGKSNVSINFSLSLLKQGKKVLLFDMDIGMGNVDILLGLSSKHTIVDMLNEDISIHDVVKRGPAGLSYIAGGTGLSTIFSLDHEKTKTFIEQLQLVLPEYDYLLFDMGAGITKESLELLMAVDDIFVITTPEPTAITDAYSAMKYIYSLDKSIPYYLIVNRVHSENEGKQTLQRLYNVVSQFLHKETVQLGILPDDRTVLKAVSHQTPYILYAPRSNISKAMVELTNRYLANQQIGENKRSSPTFISKLRNFLER
ncbi:MinD/ParA family protein [Cytobacillus sp. S13-E01]|uniref:MinD/ParA family protein n=1 Tax=Cytobacillus sp. S13-E01 TaxID=3031326 RepID=UPI0023D8578B|nr:MinD/ParA family protein [Cytobacillus sp. S13-E01]MDF0725168.1 MinD/ParA family protein [Cytobacillus sp. S13-E01]